MHALHIGFPKPLLPSFHSSISSHGHDDNKTATLFVPTHHPPPIIHSLTRETKIRKVIILSRLLPLSLSLLMFPFFSSSVTTKHAREEEGKKIDDDDEPFLIFPCRGTPLFSLCYPIVSGMYVFARIWRK